MLYSEITGEIIGAAMEVHKQMGRGFQEYIYQRALEKELVKRKLKAAAESDLPVYYKNEQIGLRKVDFLVNDLICVEIKAVADLDDTHLAQAINYLEASGKEVGLLINFGAPSLQFKRLQKRDNKSLSPHNPNKNPMNRGSIGSVICMIPARYAATRFHAKLMQLLGDKTVIRSTYDNTVATGIFDEVIVVTDSDIIYNEIVSHGGKAMMSIKQHESGSDRIAEAIENLDIDVVVNVQGDEPFVNKTVLEKLVACFDDETVQVASAMQESADEEFLRNPNFAKVVVDKDNNALYFSRSLIPFNRNPEEKVTWYKQIGIYAFRKQALLNFTSWPMGKWEKIEKLEQLRYLENGVKIHMVISEYSGFGIDSPEELEKAKELLSSRSGSSS